MSDNTLKIILALIGVAATSVPAWFAYMANRQAKATHAEVVTNHGKRQGERVEEMSDAIAALASRGEEMEKRQLLMSNVLEQIALNQAAHGRDVSALLSMVAEHAGDSHAHDRLAA